MLVALGVVAIYPELGAESKRVFAAYHRNIVDPLKDVIPVDEWSPAVFPKARESSDADGRKTIVRRRNSQAFDASDFSNDVFLKRRFRSDYH